MKGLLDVLKDVVERLDKAGIEHFLVGSLATMYYGRPRFDIMVNVEVDDAYIAEWVAHLNLKAEWNKV